MIGDLMNTVPNKTFHSFSGRKNINFLTEYEQYVSNIVQDDRKTLDNLDRSHIRSESFDNASLNRRLPGHSEDIGDDGAVTRNRGSDNCPQMSHECGTEKTYSVIEIKGETFDEYIDVVNHFENDTHEEMKIILENPVMDEQNDVAVINLESDHTIREIRGCEPSVRGKDIKILNPSEINKGFDEQLSTEKPKATYEVLKKHLASAPLVNRIVISKTSDNQMEKHLTSVELNHDPQNGVHIDESVILSECCRFEQEYQPYEITHELKGVGNSRSLFCAEDSALRYRALVFLWILLGERRLRQVGYPAEAIHVVLWRVVHTCCAVQGVRSAAAVPLRGHHDCGGDMLCFRDHVHRLLETSAPTRELWKQFGWASLTADAVIKKIYQEELLPSLLTRTNSVPLPIRMAMCKLNHLDKMAATARPVTRWRRVPKVVTSLGGTKTYMTSQYRPILPKPALFEKKRRGRPPKVDHLVTETGDRIERVMLWRFVLNLLEEPGNAACIHWINREEGIFRILNTDWLARIWGRRHGNPRMTYEKMARAMRTYYRSKVLQPVPKNIDLPRKLVYRFNPALVKRVTEK